MQKHIALTLIGILLAIAAIGWLQPNSDGAIFIVFIMLLSTNVIGGIVLRLFSLIRKSRSA